MKRAMDFYRVFELQGINDKADIYYNQETQYAANLTSWQTKYCKQTVRDYLDDATLFKIKRDESSLSGWIEA